MAWIRWSAPLLLAAVTLAAEPEIVRSEFEVPAYVFDKLGPEDQALFEKLTRVGLEAVWAQLQSRGYTQCFINELDPLHDDRRLIGRARTIRYLPNRPDVREKWYSYRKQLNYVSAEEAMPGDILLGERHGILVIPAALADEVVDAALAKSELEDFQRKLLLEGRSINGVYPPNEETLREFERSKGNR